MLRVAINIRSFVRVNNVWRVSCRHYKRLLLQSAKESLETEPISKSFLIHIFKRINSWDKSQPYGALQDFAVLLENKVTNPTTQYDADSELISHAVISLSPLLHIKEFGRVLDELSSRFKKNKKEHILGTTLRDMLLALGRIPSNKFHTDEIKNVLRQCTSRLLLNGSFIKLKSPETVSLIQNFQYLPLNYNIPELNYLVDKIFDLIISNRNNKYFANLYLTALGGLKTLNPVTNPEVAYRIFSYMATRNVVIVNHCPLDEIINAFEAFKSIPSSKLQYDADGIEIIPEPVVISTLKSEDAPMDPVDEILRKLLALLESKEFNSDNLKMEDVSKLLFHLKQFRTSYSCIESILRIVYARIDMGNIHTDIVQDGRVIADAYYSMMYRNNLQNDIHLKLLTYINYKCDQYLKFNRGKTFTGVMYMMSGLERFDSDHSNEICKALTYLTSSIDIFYYNKIINLPIKKYFNVMHKKSTNHIEVRMILNSLIENFNKRNLIEYCKLNSYDVSYIFRKFASISSNCKEGQDLIPIMQYMLENKTSLFNEGDVFTIMFALRYMREEDPGVLSLMNTLNKTLFDLDKTTATSKTIYAMGKALSFFENKSSNTPEMKEFLTKFNIIFDDSNFPFSFTDIMSGVRCMHMLNCKEIEVRNFLTILNKKFDNAIDKTPLYTQHFTEGILGFTNMDNTYPEVQTLLCNVTSLLQQTISSNDRFRQITINEFVRCMSGISHMKNNNSIFSNLVNTLYDITEFDTLSTTTSLESSDVSNVSEDIHEWSWNEINNYLWGLKFLDKIELTNTTKGQYFLNYIVNKVMYCQHELTKDMLFSMISSIQYIECEDSRTKLILGLTHKCNIMLFNGNNSNTNDNINFIIDYDKLLYSISKLDYNRHENNELLNTFIFILNNNIKNNININEITSEQYITILNHISNMNNINSTNMNELLHITNYIIKLYDININNYKNESYYICNAINNILLHNDISKCSEMKEFINILTMQLNKCPINEISINHILIALKGFNKCNISEENELKKLIIILNDKLKMLSLDNNNSKNIASQELYYAISGLYNMEKEETLALELLDILHNHLRNVDESTLTSIDMNAMSEALFGISKLDMNTPQVMNFINTVSKQIQNWKLKYNISETEFADQIDSVRENDKYCEIEKIFHIVLSKVK
jgi:hypothetical protein